MTEARVPQRIRFNRFHGNPLSPGAKLVTRPGRYGNPYKVGDPGIPDAATATGRLAALIAMRAGTLPAGDVPADLPPYPTLDEIRADLRGYDLACTCPLREPDLCHAAVLIELANYCPYRDSQGHPCELLAGHDGRHYVID